MRIYLKFVYYQPLLFGLRDFIPLYNRPDIQATPKCVPTTLVCHRCRPLIICSLAAWKTSTVTERNSIGNRIPFLPSKF